MKFVLVLLISYLIGSIPCGYLIGRKHKVDLRRHGSGNIGATNAFRILGPEVGLLVLLCDVAKGLLPVLIANNLFGPFYGVGAGLAVMAGHSWSVFLRFQGGRGVATGAGVLIALMPGVVLIAFVIWIVVVLFTGYVSLGSILASVAVPFIALILHIPWEYYIFAVPAPIIIVIRHLPNIRRLQAGTENRIRFW
ncbi:MAG: glycerol-3-phosphate 1-O-acyltransferase PlsY [Thermacetogeniaceae bacterium]|jgi:glycerol-3-phosphate acyltransferase PlsY|nr:glycerol-3-phosphate 1-O-acyltransferase PlsY [Syntrophomonadaceae bacterium]